MSHKMQNIFAAIGAVMVVVMLVATYSVTSGRVTAWIAQSGTQVAAAPMPSNTPQS